MEIISPSEDYQSFLDDMINEYKSMVKDMRKFERAVAEIGQTEHNNLKMRYARESQFASSLDTEFTNFK